LRPFAKALDGFAAAFEAHFGDNKICPGTTHDTCLCASGGAQSGVPSSNTPARVFRAGAAASNITPPLGISINGYFNDRTAKGIHDELHARCLVLDDVYTRVAIVVCDSCMIPREVMDAAKQMIQQRVGIPPSVY
jgi:hypothetical protein